jgi:hypothetical protein
MKRLLVALVLIAGCGDISPAEPTGQVYVLGVLAGAFCPVSQYGRLSSTAGLTLVSSQPQPAGEVPMSANGWEYVYRGIATGTAAHPCNPATDGPVGEQTLGLIPYNL